MEDDLESSSPVNLDTLDVSIGESPEVRHYRSILGVANHFTDHIHSVAPAEWMADPELLLKKTGLTKQQLVGVLNDEFGSMDELYALIDVLPKLNDFFGRRPAHSIYQKKSWEAGAQFFSHLRAEGMTREQQAAHIGMTIEDFDAFEKGEFSPSLDEFRRVVTLPGLEDSHLGIGIPHVSHILDQFLERQKWKYNQLASQVRIPVGRIYSMLRGSQPTPEEFKKLRALIPNLPTWRAGRPRKNVQEKPESKPTPEPEVAEEVAAEEPEEPEEPKETPTLSEAVTMPEARVRAAELLADEGRLKELLADPDLAGKEEEALRALRAIADPKSEEPKPKSIPPPSPSQKVPSASDYLTLTEEERARIIMFEDALLRLCNPEPLKRNELFPDDPSSAGKHWQLDFIHKLVHAGVISRDGERFNARYVGNKDRVEALLSDAEWLLRLTYPAVLHRPIPSEEVDDVVHDPEKIEDIPTGTDILRVLPQYYEVLTYQHERIGAVEKLLGTVNAKLDAILAHLGIPLPTKEPNDVSGCIGSAVCLRPLGER